MEQKKEQIVAGDIPVFCAHDALANPTDLVGNPRNPNKHPQEQIKLLAHIIQKQGWRVPITVSRRSGYIVRGHGRLEAALYYGAQLVPVDYQEYANEAEEWADLIADNRIAEFAVMDADLLSELFVEIEQSVPDFDLELSGYTTEQIMGLTSDGSAGDERQQARVSLQERFIIPPFTILDARSGAWIARKRAWKNLGIKSEIGRGNDDDKTADGLIFQKSSQPPSAYNAKNAYEDKIGSKITWDEFAKLFPQEMKMTGTSIFDPVLCEWAYRWFCPIGGQIIDPFAGGSVRGIVASLTGRAYTGVDLSERQIKANIENWAEIGEKEVLTEGETSDAKILNWIIGDSRNIVDLAKGEYDMLFTCPPYVDLEVYSDAPEDLSNKSYPEFMRLYREIIGSTVSMLKDDRFACIVVGEVRDKKGSYYNFVGDTIRAFTDAGMSYYNEAILIPTYGSLAIRAGGQFIATRKLGKAHQNVLIFVKGDPKRAVEAIGTPDTAKDLLETGDDCACETE